MKSTVKSPSRQATDRPEKPYPEFPLYAQPLGYCCKKIKGKQCRFGRWGRVVGGKLTRVEGDGWKEALELYKVQRNDLYAGREPRPAYGTEAGLQVKDLCNAFLTAKQRKLNAGELATRVLLSRR